MGDSNLFYCHACEADVILFYGESSCPNCDSGFVEQWTPSTNIGSSPSVEDVFELDTTGNSYNVPLQDIWTYSESRSPNRSPSPPEIADASTMDMPTLEFQILDQNAERQAMMIEIFNMLRQPGNPLSAQQQTEIPIIIMSNEKLENNPICTICLEHFQLDELVRQLLCEHMFHEICIMPWLQENDTCPNCRKCLAEPVNEMDAVD